MGGKETPVKLNEKIHRCRRKAGLSQEALAERIGVSRQAISKWETGRGYPNIDSLKAISQHFSVSIDDLLSGGELLTLAQEDVRARETRLRDVVSGLLDCSAALLLFLPFFGQRTDGGILPVSLLALTGKSSWLMAAFMAVVIALCLCGLLTLALQRCQHPLWIRWKGWLSLGLTASGALLFTACRQPYASAFLFFHLIIKGFLPAKPR